MKIRRILGVALVVVTAVTGLVFSGCGDKNDDNGGNKTYTLEAEYIDLSEVQGAGESSSQAGVQMIYGDGDQEDKDKGWSEGYFVGYTYVADLQLDFNFTSDKESTATIILRLGSELGSLNLTNSIFEVKLNGKTVPYASLSVPGGTVLEEIQFHDLKLKDNAKINAGENTISLIVK
ncbi:MAG: hypothetical protein J6B04_03435, partial [Clostridia bacterium]|nr:hypothetical protein [Clostridia bacterium]